MSIERKVKPFRLPDEISVTMLEVYGSSNLDKEMIFKLEDVVSIVLDNDDSEEKFEVSFINGATISLKYDKTDIENLSYNELKTIWFRDMAIRRKEHILNDHRLELVKNMLDEITDKMETMLKIM